MIDNTPIDIFLESILFHKSEPLKITELARILSITREEVQEGLIVLKEKLKDRGVVLIVKEDQAMLGTAPESAFLIEELIKGDLDKDLGKAGVETLSIVLYKGPISRPDIDYIRGVNSSYVLRNLLIRGLVERITREKRFFYRPTFELLSYLGVTEVSELPDYKSANKEIEELIEINEETKTDNG